MNNQPLNFYKTHLENCTAALAVLKRKSLLLSISRLLVFSLVLVAIYFFSHHTKVSLLIGLGGVVAFFLLLHRYISVKEKIAIWNKKSEILTSEIVFLNDGFMNAEDGSEFIEPNHFFASDIDVFGSQSLFQYINRTHINESKVRLAEIITSNNIENINEKQAVIKDLSGNPEWRLNYATRAALVDQDISQKTVLNWINDYKPSMAKLFTILRFVFPVLSGLFLLLYISNITNFLPLLFIFIGGLIITLFYISKINRASIHLSQLKSVFNHYGNIVEQIENEEFKSAGCQSAKSLIVTSNKSASLLIKEFSRYLNALDQRNNILFAILGNAFFLWDCVQLSKIEKWISTNKPSVSNWFESIVWFETQCSLANFHFNHPDFNFPKVDLNANNLIEAKALGHFFIDGKKRISNDFTVKSNSFSIITGANMAGKSTFLRTVAISIVSANIGLPVCAISFKYSPIKLITSMRNTDSLKDDSSYFFAELARLKIIVDAVNDEPYFVILDEILKGTNSKDKEEGSIKLMQKLSKTKAAGLIATHDLGLCEIEKDLSNVHNQYFDAEIIDDELFFDYTLKDGVCQNMNASFLLKKMQII